MGEDAVIGQRVGAGAIDFAEKEANETAGAHLLEFAFLLVVDVEDVELAGAAGACFGGGLEPAAEDGCAEGIEEKGDARAGGERVGDGIGAGDADGGKGAAGFAPHGGIAASARRESRMQLDADDLLERHLRREENGAAHARAYVHKGGVPQGGDGPCALPALKQGGEDGRGDAVVGGGVAVVGVAAAEVTAGDEAAGADAVGQVPGMGEKAVFDGEAGQEAAAGLRRFGGHRRRLAREWAERRMVARFGRLLMALTQAEAAA